MAGGGTIGGIGGPGDYNLQRPLPAGLRQETGSGADINIQESVELSRNTSGTGIPGAESVDKSVAPTAQAPVNRQSDGPPAVNAPTVLTMLDAAGPTQEISYPDGVHRVGEPQIIGMYAGVRAQI